MNCRLAPAVRWDRRSAGPHAPELSLSAYARAANEDASIAYDAKELRVEIAAAVATLNALEERVIRLRYGFGDDQAISLASTAARLGIDEETIRRAELKGLRKLRHPTRSRVLWVFVDPERSEGLRLRDQAAGASTALVRRPQAIASVAKLGRA